MHLTTRRSVVITILLCGVFLGFAVGCGGKRAAPVAPEPFKKAIAEYLERNNMAIALKEIKEGPTVKDNMATLKASLTHVQLAGPSVTWEIRFEKNPDGSWKAVSHK